MIEYVIYRFYAILLLLAFFMLLYWLSHEEISSILFYFATRYADWYMGK